MLGWVLSRLCGQEITLIRQQLSRASRKRGSDLCRCRGLGVGAEEAAVALRPACAGHVCRGPEGRAVN